MENNKPKSLEDVQKKLNQSLKKSQKNNPSQNSLDKKEMYLKQTDRNYKDGDRN